MSSPLPPLPDRAEATATLLAWGRRLLRRSSSETPLRSVSPVDSLQEAGQRLRGAREGRGLSLRQLAQETRISITVLEALEKGWRDRLPEPTYLRTMLSLLERHLDLEPSCLEVALPPRRHQASRPGADPRLRRVSLASIELFSTWQGVVLYGGLCLLLIYGLNRQQQRLAARGLYALRPIPAAPAAGVSVPSEADRDRARVLAAYPEIRPLERAGRGQALARLRRDLPPEAAAPGRLKPSGAAPAAPPASATPPASGAPQATGAAAAAAAKPVQAPQPPAPDGASAADPQAAGAPRP
ncbi:MAG: helix-turn-helix domain-containing protein [Cyanobium sp.]